MHTFHRRVCLSVLLLAACNGSGDPGGSAGESGSTGGPMLTTGASDPPTTTGEPDAFGPEQEFALRLNDAPVPPLKLTMNKAQAAEFFGPTASEVLLVEVESTTLLTNSLEQIKTSCGTGWMANDPDPKHNCAGTDYKGPDNTWETSAEYSLVRILTMTPANARVEGTSIEGMQGLADGLGIGGGFGQILAESLGIDMTVPFITTPELVVALQRNLLATHPGVGGDGTKLPIYLDDALHDLATLADKLGPAPPHPGILATDFPTQSQVLTDDFQMTVVADSNLRLLDGVDLDKGKDYMSTVVDVVGPTYNDPLEFDFNDPEKFNISGVVDQPTVDMRFALSEHEEFINSCAGDDACKKNLPENQAQVDAMWPGSAWAIDPWLLEAIIATGGREKYKSRIFDKCYEVLFTCALGARITIGDPAGWIMFDVFLNLGNPPKDQFVWELINEVAQVALHSPPAGDIPEGEADVAFTLRDVQTGISADTIATAVRPYLQEQAPEIAQLVLGDYWKNNGAVDFYYRRGSDGKPYLFFVTDADLKPGETYDYKNPGFFTCPKVQPDCKASQTVIDGAGDDTHEKIKLPAGESTFYIQDDTGTVYRARFVVPDGSAQEITAFIAAPA